MAARRWKSKSISDVEGLKLQCNSPERQWSGQLKTAARGGGHPLTNVYYTHNQYTSQEAHIILFSIRALHCVYNTSVCGARDLCVNAECAVLNRAAAAGCWEVKILSPPRSPRVPFSCLMRGSMQSTQRCLDLLYLFLSLNNNHTNEMRVSVCGLSVNEPT